MAISKPLRKTGVLGFEPRLTDSESVVLPLHHTPRNNREIDQLEYHKATLPAPFRQLHSLFPRERSFITRCVPRYICVID